MALEKSLQGHQMLQQTVLKLKSQVPPVVSKMTKQIFHSPQNVEGDGPRRPQALLSFHQVSAAGYLSVQCMPAVDAKACCITIP